MLYALLFLPSFSLFHVKRLIDWVRSVTFLHEKRNQQSSKSALTPQSSTQDLGVEFLLVFADLRGVALRTDVGRIHVDNRPLPRVLSSERLHFRIKLLEMLYEIFHFIEHVLFI